MTKKKKQTSQLSIRSECNQEVNLWTKVQSNDIKLNKIAIGKVKKIARNSVAANKYEASENEGVKHIRRERERVSDWDILCVYILSLFLWSFQTSWISCSGRCVFAVFCATNQRTNTKIHREWTVITTLHNVNIYSIQSLKYILKFKVHRGANNLTRTNLFSVYSETHSITFLCLQEVNH